MNNYSNKQAEVILRKDKEWRLIDGELLLVTDFSPLMGSTVKDGVAISSVSDVPYASISIESKKIKEKTTGFITHKEDFINLWSAFKEIGINQGNEEVLIYWTTKRYNNIIAKILSSFLLGLLGSTPFPKIVVMVCKKGTYESCPDGFPLLPDKKILVFVYGLMSIKWWIPDIMK